MKVVLCMLALLAVASTASATFAPWYHQVLFKNKCYVPGCDEVRMGRGWVQAVKSLGGRPTRRRSRQRHAQWSARNSSTSPQRMDWCSRWFAYRAAGCCQRLGTQSSQFGGHSLLCGQRLEIPGTVTYRMTACVKRQMQLLETHCCDHLLNCCLLLHHVLLLPDFPAFFLCVPAAVCSALTTSLTLVPSAPMAMPC